MTLRPFSLTIALLFASSTLVPAVVWAQASDADKGTARDLTIAGYAALKSNDFAGAADRFTRADALYHAATITLGLARARLGLGKLVGAQEAYSRVVHEPVPANASAAQLKAVDDANKELAALTPRVPSVIIEVKGTDAPTVTLDGVAVPTAALGVKRPVDPGQHVVHAVAPGFAPSDVTVTLAEGKTETVTLKLTPTDVPPVVTTPPVNAVLSPPDVSSPAVTPAPLPDQGASGGSQRKTIGFVALGVGAAGLVVGGITGGLALSKHGDLATKCPDGHCAPSQQASLQSDVDSFHTMGAISTIGFAAGGALAVTGVILILTAPKSAPQKAGLTPLVGLGYLGARGTF